MGNMSKFDIELPIDIEKSEGAEWVIKGIASGPELDLEGQQAHRVALQRMVDQVNATHLPFYDWHKKDSSMAEIGEVTKAWLDENDRVGVEVELDQDHPMAQWLWKKLEKGKQFGMSVKGTATNVKRELDKTIGRSVATYYDAFLEEISLTTKPIYTHSFGTVLKKAIDEESAKSVETGDNASMSEETPNAGVENQPADSGADDSATPEVVTTTTETTVPVESSEPETETADSDVSVEKAVSTDTKRDAAKLRRVVKHYQELGALLSELGLVEDNETADTSTDSVIATDQLISKSEEGIDTLSLQKAMDEIATLRDYVEELKGQIPAVDTPPILIRKSEDEELREWFAAASPRERLVVGLAGTQRNIR